MQIGVRDKFFYDSILDRFTELADEFNCSKDFTLIAHSLRLNPQFLQDNEDFVRQFYKQTYEQRYLLNH